MFPQRFSSIPRRFRFGERSLEARAHHQKSSPQLQMALACRSALKFRTSPAAQVVAGIFHRGCHPQTSASRGCALPLPHKSEEGQWRGKRKAGQRRPSRYQSLVRTNCQRNVMLLFCDTTDAWLLAQNHPTLDIQPHYDVLTTTRSRFFRPGSVTGEQCARLIRDVQLAASFGPPVPQAALTTTQNSQNGGPSAEH